MPDPSLSAPPGIPPLSSIAAPPSGAPALGSGNPILDEIDNAHASLSPPAKQAIEDAHGIIGLRPADTAQATESAAPSLAPMTAPASPGLPPVGQSPLAPALSLGGQPGQTGAQHELSRLQTTGSGISQIHSPWARVPLQILDAIGGGLFPGIEQRLPGTAGHHDVLLAQQGKAVSQEEGERAAEDKSALEQAQAQNQEAIPELKRTAADLAASKEREIETGHRNTEDINRAKNQGVQDTAAAKEAGRAETAAANRKASLASHGYEENEKGEIVPLSYEKMSETQQAVHDLKSAQSEQAEATAALKKAQASNQPAMVALAQKRLDSASQAHQIASERLGLSEKQFEMRAHGTEGGVPLPGSAQTQSGETVGTANAKNVLPTGNEITKGDLARSAVDRVGEMRDILKRRPDLFGPGNGRVSSLQMAIGNQDPEAQKFLAASKYLADHSAALFGGRSKYISEGLESLSAPKINVSALNAAIDEAEKTAKPFAEAGTRHTIGGPHEIKPNGAPSVGAVDGGYKFKGGDPKDQKNWEKVK